MEDVEPFIDWLREHGTPEAHLVGYRQYAAELAKHPSLSAALEAAKAEGRDGKQIGNLRTTAARIAEFEASRSAPAPLEIEPPRARPVALEVEPPRARPAPSANLTKDLAPQRRGCVCSRRDEVFLDNDLGALAKMLGGGAGIGTFLLVRMVGLLGALSVALGLAGLGGVATIISICFRCQGCRRKVTDLDDTERAALHKGRGRVTIVTVALLAGAVVCALIWWNAVRSARYSRY